MKALIFTRDKMSFDVLARCLKQSQFTDCVMLEPLADIASSPPTDDQCMAFVDFDVNDASEVTLYLPSTVNMVPFGSHQARLNPKIPHSAIEMFLTKPFDQEQVKRVTRAALLADSQLPLPAAATQRKSIVALADQLETAVQEIKEQRRQLASKLTATPEQLRAMITPQTVFDAQGFPVLPPDALPLRSALIIDKDASFARMVAGYLAKKCVLEVNIVETGDKAWKILQDRPYDIVILQWEITGLSGLALYNRLRTTANLRYVPLIVTSNAISAHDFRLLDEDFAVTLIQKPVSEQLFSEKLEHVAGDALVGRDRQHALLGLVTKSLRQGSWSKDAAGMTQGPHIEPLLLNALRLAGDQFVAEKDYLLAETAYAHAWKLGDRRLALMTGYAKSCFLSGHADTARKILSTADVLAPKNVERLCLLGEIDLSMQNPEIARQRFLAAAAIDTKSKKARAGILVAETMLAHGELLSPSTNDQESVTSRFTSYLNMIGINLSRSGKIDQAARYYKAAMTFVRDPDDVVKLWFNLGLCYLRGKQKSQAEEAFQQAYKLSDGTFSRAVKYLRDDSNAKRDDFDDSEMFERF